MNVVGGADQIEANPKLLKESKQIELEREVSERKEAQD